MTFPSRFPRLAFAALLSVSAFFFPTGKSVVAQGPEASGTKTSFDVASIKENKSGIGRHSLNLGLPGGRVRAINVSLAGLMTEAYQVAPNRILGAPSWFDSAQFDIEAASEDSPGVEGNRLRLQSLLGERFKLKFHHEMRPLRVYALVMAHAGAFGPQLRVNTEQCEPPPPALSPGLAPLSVPSSLNCGDVSENTTPREARYAGRKITMDKLLIALAGPTSDPNIDRPIVDRTGLSDSLDFSLRFAPSMLASSDEGDSLPPFARALEEQLGLKLEARTDFVDVIFIDHVERPSPN